MHLHHLNCVLLDTGSGCASPLSIDGVAFGVGTWSISRISTVQVGQTVLDRYTLALQTSQYRMPAISHFHLLQCPAPSTYRRLTHKPWASYSHALRLSDWRLVSRMTVWEPRSNLGAGITVRLPYADLLVASRGLSDQSA